MYYAVWTMERMTKIFHVVDRHEEPAGPSLDRKWNCQKTWDNLIERGEIIPVHVWPHMYERTAKDIGESRPLPYLKDLLEIAMTQCWRDDIILWTNSDNLIHDELPEYLRFHVAVYGPCSIFRTELRHGLPRVGLSPEQVARDNREQHIGRDGFAFTKGWLEDNWSMIPDSVLACRMWDVHLAAVIRLHYQIATTNANIGTQMFPAEIPLGYTGHLPHKSSWLENVNSPGSSHNGRLFIEFTKRYLPTLKVTNSGDLA